jgi:uncharacterized phiE125 gp8 family phage protein
MYYKPYERAYTYKILEAPTNLAVTLDQVKDHLRINPGTEEDTKLTSFIKSATEIAEKYTKRTFINTKFRTYRDCFECCIQLRRSKLQTLHAFQYSKDDSFINVDTNLYYVTDENDFSKIMLKDGKSYPSDIDNRLQAIQIDFTAGFGADSTSIPNDLHEALLNHIAALYEDRGDCNLLTDAESALPATSLSTYKKNRIWDVANGCV